jgi:hypothetical protein
VRFVLELSHTKDGVEGELTPEGTGSPQPFTSWLELLRLLEPSGPENTAPSGRSRMG